MLQSTHSKVKMLLIRKLQNTVKLVVSHERKNTGPGPRAMLGWDLRKAK
jgi:hypothetical protein